MKTKGSRRFATRLAGALSCFFALMAGAGLMLPLGVNRLASDVSPEDFLAVYHQPKDFLIMGYGLCALAFAAVSVLFCLLWRRLKRNGLRTGEIRRRLNARADELPDFPMDEKGRAVLSLTVDRMEDMFSPG